MFRKSSNFAAANRKIRCILPMWCATLMKAARVDRMVRQQHSSNKKTMYLSKEKKAEIFEKFGQNAQDTGSVESQVALFTYRIAHLTEHLKQNHKDHATARSLTMLVGKRRKLLRYVKERDIERYRALIKALGLRR